MHLITGTLEYGRCTVQACLPLTKELLVARVNKKLTLKEMSIKYVKDLLGEPEEGTVEWVE